MGLISNYKILEKREWIKTCRCYTKISSKEPIRLTQKRIVSPSKITSQVGERIRYLSKHVGPWTNPTLAQDVGL